jgi:O-antigen/teichoic acid export membrane protein
MVEPDAGDGPVSKAANTEDRPLSTAGERARVRYRQVRRSAVASAAAKALSIFTALISVPLTLKYLGAERYGMWLTLSGFASMLSFADLGIGAGVTNAVAAADGRGDQAAMRAVVASGFLTLSGVAAAIMVALFISYPLVNWAAIFNVSSPLARHEAGPALAAFILCLAAAFPVGIVERLQMGVQRSFLASLWRCIGSMASLIAVLAAIWYNAGLVWLVLAFSGAPVLAAVCNGIVFFVNNPLLRPRLTEADLQSTKFVAQDGILFFLIQIFSSLAKYSDNLIIAQLLGAAAVPLFAVPEKLFAQISGIAAMALWPLWPAYREAAARRDNAWIRRTLGRSLQLTFLCTGLAAAALVVAGPFLIAAWTDSAIHPSFWLLVGLAVWKTLESTSFALETFLSGVGALRRLAIGWGMTAAAAIGLELLIIPQAGITGAVWATIAAFTACGFLPWLLAARRHARGLTDHGDMTEPLMP